MIVVSLGAVVNFVNTYAEFNGYILLFCDVIFDGIGASHT